MPLYTTEALILRTYKLGEADRIVTLELPPGSLVSERALMERLELGRTPVREALRALARDRLVEVYPRRGMFVSSVDVRDLAGLSEVRMTLEPRAAEWGMQLPRVPPGDIPGYHLYYVLLPDRATRDRVMGAMRAAGVMVTFHYVPLHSSPGGRRFAARPTHCPVTDDVSERLIRLPFHNALTPQDVERVVATLSAALG